MRDLATLSAREFLALAIFLEEEHARVHGEFSYALREEFPQYAAVLLRLGHAGSARRLRLVDLFHNKFGKHIPLVRRQDVRGFRRLKALWLVRPLTLRTARKQVETIGHEVRDFYIRAAGLAGDAEIHELLYTFLKDDTLNGHGKQRPDNDAKSIQAKERGSWLRRFLG